MESSGDNLKRPHFAALFGDSLPLPPQMEPHLESALRHVLSTPGSLVRPCIVYQIALAYGLPAAPAKDLAIALEYFHTASLLIDDLPCMDDASQRRGAACVHVKFDEATAILSALALINRAYALTWRTIAACPSAHQAAAMEYIEQRLGVEGLLNGQSLDLHYGSLPHDRTTTESVARDKTVSLIRLTLVLPALLGEATPQELQLLERIALYWGLSYQIADDLKDILQDPSESGKTGSRDRSLDRPNIALVVGIDRAVERLNRFITLGDRSLTRLLTLRPGVDCLQKLRDDLHAESRRIVQGALQDSLVSTGKDAA